MKKSISIILLAIALCFADNLMAQNAKRDANGNYSAIVREKVKEPAKATGNTFTDSKGTVYPVFVSESGKLFYTKNSKTGKEYKVYLKVS